MARFSVDIKTVPNLLTLARIVLVLICVGCYFVGYIGIGLVLGTIAGATDYLDGIIARRTGQETYLGAILDQFSDLILEATFLLMLVEHPLGPHPAWLVVYLFREFWVGTIRRFMAAHQINIKSNFYGKLKTNFVGWGFVPWFMYLTDFIPVLSPYLFWIAQLGLYGGLAWGYLSGWLYTKQFVEGYNKLETVA